MLKRSFFLFALILTFSLVPAQEPYSITIDKSQGLPSNNVYDIFEDSKGFIWIAHNEGLTRYDGHTFKTFFPNGQTSPAGSHIREDMFGRVWYETFDGYLHYAEGDSARVLQQEKPMDYIHFGLIKDKLFTVRYKYIYTYDLKTLQLKEKIPFDTDSLISVAHTNEKVIYSLGHIRKWHGHDGKLKDLKVKNKRGEWFDRATVFSKDGKIILFDRYAKSNQFGFLKDDGVVDYKTLDIEIEAQNLSYVDGKCWFCTTRGVYCADENGTLLNGGKPYFGNKSISSVVRDKEGNYWFSTTNEGLLFVPSLNTRVMMNDVHAEKLGISGHTLFVGTDNDKIYSCDLPSKKNSLIYDGNSNKAMFSLFVDSISRCIVFCSRELGICDFKGKMICNRSMAMKDCRLLNASTYIYASTGLSGYLFKRNATHRKLPDHSIQEIDLNGFSMVSVVSGRGKAVAATGNGQKVYFATNQGLFYQNNFRNFGEIKYNDTSLYLIQLAGFGNEVFGLTALHKLIEIGDDGKPVPAAFVKNIPYEIRSISQGSHYLFIQAGNRIYSVDLLKRERTISEINVIVPDGGITDMVLYKNELLLAINKGVISVPIEQSVSRPVLPVFIINKITVNRVDRKAQELMNLSYLESDLEIQYSILSFRTGSRFPLYYRINEGRWELTPPESRALKLAALAPGTYHIEFMMGNPGRGVLVGEQVSIHINQPWWQTWWALFLFMAIIVIFFTTVYRWQTRVLKRQNFLLQQKIELEKDLRQSTLKSIKAQMNPHFFYNALNTIQNFIFTDDKRNASTYLSKFSKLTRTILEMSEKETVSLAEELEALKLYLEIEKARFSDDFNFEITLSDDLNPDLIKIPSMLIQPYVENAIKHGLLHKKGEKRLGLTFLRTGNLLEVHIDDNGIGRTRSAEINKTRNASHRSFATNANSLRLDLLNKGEGKVGVEYNDKTDILGNSLGTSVLIRIPIV